MFLYLPQESQREDDAITELQRRLGVSVSLSGPGLQIIDESDDKEFIELGSKLIGEKVSNNEQGLVSQVFLKYFIVFFLGMFC